MKSATTITKVCRVIGELSTRKWFGISELSRRTGLLPSDVHRIVTSLKSNGYVDQDLETKKYGLSVPFLRIGLGACQRNELYARAYPALVALSRRLRATTHLAAFDAQELDVFLVAHVNWPLEETFKAKLGELQPMHSSALGKAVLAKLEPSDAVRALRKRNITRSTRYTITDLAALKKQLEQVRTRGYAVDQEEYFDGVCCLASPIVDWAGQPIGAISASMPTSQFLAQDETVLAENLKAAVRAATDARGISQLREIGMGTPSRDSFLASRLKA